MADQMIGHYGGYEAHPQGPNSLESRSMPTSALVSYMSVRPAGAGFPVPCSVHPVGYDHAREAGRSYQIALRAIRLSKNIKLGFVEGNENMKL